MTEPSHSPRPPVTGSRAVAPRGWAEPRFLAIAGLVLALVPCCPMTGLLGAFLGVFALRRIRLAGGAARGANIALAAIVAGAASALVWSIALDQLSAAQQEALQEEIGLAVTAALEAAQNEDPAALLEVWSTSDTAPTAEEITAFGQAALERCGPVERFAFISLARSGTLLRPVVDVAGVGHFDRAEPLVAARLEVRVLVGRIPPVVRLLRLTIEDEPRGDLTLGRPASPEPGSEPPASEDP